MSKQDFGAERNKELERLGFTEAFDENGVRESIRRGSYLKLGYRFQGRVSCKNLLENALRNNSYAGERDGDLGRGKIVIESQ